MHVLRTLQSLRELFSCRVVWVRLNLGASAIFHTHKARDISQIKLSWIVKIMQDFLKCNPSILLKLQIILGGWYLKSEDECEDRLVNFIYGLSYDLVEILIVWHWLKTHKIIENSPQAKCVLDVQSKSTLLKVNLHL